MQARTISSLPAGALIVAWHHLYRVVKHTARRTYVEPVEGGELPYTGHLLGDMPKGGREGGFWFEWGTPASVSDGRTRRVIFVALNTRDVAEALLLVGQMRTACVAAAARINQVRDQLRQLEDRETAHLEELLGSSGTGA